MKSEILFKINNQNINNNEYGYWIIALIFFIGYLFILDFIFHKELEVILKITNRNMIVKCTE